MVERTAFLICGLAAILIGRVHARLTQEIYSFSFGISLIAVGVLAAGIGLLPKSWLLRATAEDNDGRLTLRLKFLLSFAAMGALLVVILRIVPLRSFNNPVIMLINFMCPACEIGVAVGWSFVSVLVWLAPLNGLVFGAFGGVMGGALSLIRVNWR